MNIAFPTLAVNKMKWQTKRKFKTNNGNEW